MLPHIGTMQTTSSLLSEALLCALLLLSSTRGAEVLDTESEEELSPELCGTSTPKLGALHEVLEKLQAKRLPSWEKKFGQVPTCDIGEQCAVRKGARIGKMCDCPRGAFCNFFLLKCL
ncbi:hypothetical protein F7725_026699 [Dissostichus mawsoni]|uniref:Cocaine- and amphetamine-regulated transcript protein n=1 Tax=Dissostichus mawsoni TaxID=36200 RepID=A0A7J5X7R9_DISMA|nr:hypothetical protein F7725_026699 [Dissostichus mawsoni]